MTGPARDAGTGRGRDLAAFGALALAATMLLVLLRPDPAGDADRPGGGPSGEPRELTPDDPLWLPTVRRMADDPELLDPQERAAGADRMILFYEEALRGAPEPGRIHLMLAALNAFRSPPDATRARYHRNLAVRAGLRPPDEIDQAILARGIRPETLLAPPER